jgi:hypothetical protein
MKTGIKLKNYDFLVMPFKHVPTFMGFVNCTGTTNCGQELTKTAIKLKNDEFLVMPLKHVPSVMGLVNRPRTPKRWAIAQENNDKT